MRYTIPDLLYLMECLRAPVGGCPWDLAQSPSTIINYSIEEVYELAAAIEQNDSAAVQDELGDVLFQVVFMAQLANENKEFEFDDVVHGVCEKLLRRHPHVFPRGVLYPTNDITPQNVAIDAETVAKNWEAIKQLERNDKQLEGLFADVPLALPAMSRAKKLQKRAASIGLDWPDIHGAFASLSSELSELETVLHAMRPMPPGEKGVLHSAQEAVVDDDAYAETHRTIIEQQLADELGDVLFSCVNVARKAGLNPEQCLRQANQKFARRAEFVKSQLDRYNEASTGLDDPADADLSSSVEALWVQAKQQT
jgi:ATP diphosphatase